MSFSTSIPTIPAIISDAPCEGAEFYLSNTTEGRVTDSTNMTDLGNPLPTVTIMHKLGEGACGKVFVGKLEGKNDSVAVKVIPKNMVDSIFLENIFWNFFLRFFFSLRSDFRKRQLPYARLRY